MYLERWMVDEISDGDVRVLRSALRDDGAAVEAVTSVRSVLAARDSQPERAAAKLNRKLAIDLEAARIDIWTRETEMMADLAGLTDFLVRARRRAARHGLPSRYDLREGDVFWVIRAEADVEGAAGVGDLATNQAEALLARFDRTQAAHHEPWHAHRGDCSFLLRSQDDRRRIAHWRRRAGIGPGRIVDSQLCSATDGIRRST